MVKKRDGSVKLMQNMPNCKTVMFVPSLFTRLLCECAVCLVGRIIIDFPNYLQTVGSLSLGKQGRKIEHSPPPTGVHVLQHFPQEFMFSSTSHRSSCSPALPTGVHVLQSPRSQLRKTGKVTQTSMFASPYRLQKALIFMRFEQNEFKLFFKIF